MRKSSSSTSLNIASEPPAFQDLHEILDGSAPVSLDVYLDTVGDLHDSTLWCCGSLKTAALTLVPLSQFLVDEERRSAVRMA